MAGKRVLTIIAAAVLVVAAGVVAGCSVLHERSYIVPSEAMSPALKRGNPVNVNTSRTHPQIGDIIAFHLPEDGTTSSPTCGDPSQGPGHRAMCDQAGGGKSDELTLRRVVGLPGDRLTMKRGQLIRNGSPEPHSGYKVASCTKAKDCTFRKAITVPAGEYFVLGDNRGIAQDSRFYGPIPQSYIQGTVTGA